VKPIVVDDVVTAVRQLAKPRLTRAVLDKRR
jgi:hypothetical protein